MSSALPRVSPTVILKEMDSGAVLFCSRTEVYFGLNSVGLFIWRFLEASASEKSVFTSLVRSLSHQYPDIPLSQLETDAREFLDAMEDSELVMKSSDAGPVTP